LINKDSTVKIETATYAKTNLGKILDQALLEPIFIHKKVYHLESLLKQVNKKNLRNEIVTSLAKGHEIW